MTYRIARRATRRTVAVRRALGILAAIGAIVATACSDPKHTGGAPPAVPVTVARVERQAVPYEIDATGTVEPLQTVAVSSQVGGVLTRVAFKEGDVVQRGQLLFQIDPRPYVAALRQAQGTLARDRAQLANAQQDVKRYEELVKKDYVTPQQFEATKTTAASLQATVSAEEGGVESARLNLEYATIRAPITGRAGALLVREGNVVRANGQTLVVINQIRPILVRFAVPASNLPRIQQYRSDTLPIHAQPVAGGAVTSAGTFSFLDNAVDTTTGTILLKGQFPNSDAALWPGEFVNVALQLYVQPDAVVAPAPAVVQSQQGSYVFVVNPNGTAAMRDVTVSRTIGNLAVIEKGLAPGDVVVTDGQIRLTNGTKVQIKSEAGGDQPKGQ